MHDIEGVIDVKHNPARQPAEALAVVVHHGPSHAQHSKPDGPPCFNGTTLCLLRTRREQEQVLHAAQRRKSNWDSILTDATVQELPSAW